MSAPTLTFSPAMFHAAHVARIKTVTRRLIEGLDAKAIEQFVTRAHDGRQLARLHSGMCVDFGPPAHRPGETKPMVTSWAVCHIYDSVKPSELRSANGKTLNIWFDDGSKKPSWAGKSRPARFLPKSLYHLAPQCRIESARPEPLHHITGGEVLAEGIPNTGPRLDTDRGIHKTSSYWVGERCFYDPIAAYFHLWDSLYPDHPAHTNPIVWRYQFTPL